MDNSLWTKHIWTRSSQRRRLSHLSDCAIVVVTDVTSVAHAVEAAQLFLVHVVIVLMSGKTGTIEFSDPPRRQFGTPVVTLCGTDCQHGQKVFCSLQAKTIFEIDHFLFQFLGKLHCWNDFERKISEFPRQIKNLLSKSGGSLCPSHLTSADLWFDDGTDEEEFIIKCVQKS